MCGIQSMNIIFHDYTMSLYWFSLLLRILVMSLSSMNFMLIFGIWSFALFNYFSLSHYQIVCCLSYSPLPLCIGVSLGWLCFGYAFILSYLWYAILMSVYTHFHVCMHFISSMSGGILFPFVHSWQKGGE